MLLRVVRPRGFGLLHWQALLYLNGALPQVLILSRRVCLQAKTATGLCVQYHQSEATNFR